MKCLVLAALFGLNLYAVGQHRPTTGSHGQSTPPSSQKPSSEPSLVETETWIKNTFTDDNVGQHFCHEFASMDAPSSDADYGAQYTCMHRTYGLDLNGCKATFYVFNSHTHSPCDGDKYGNVCDAKDDKSNDSVVEFDLGDIDPSTIKMSEPYGTFGEIGKKTFHANLLQVGVCVATTNSSDKMTIRYFNSNSAGQPYRTHSLCGLGDFVVGTVDYVPRFVKAFTHAVTLCGGRPSAF